MLVGGNGAGKSTFYRLALEPLALPFVNADQLARFAFPDDPEVHSYEVAMLAEGLLYQLLNDGLSFCFETVYSHPSKIDFVALAKALGYQIIMVFIHLESTGLNQARVAMRVNDGGHDLPPEKMISSIPRLLQHVRASIPLVDVLRVYDKSSALDSLRPVLTIRQGALQRHQNPLPPWAAALIADPEG